MLPQLDESDEMPLDGIFFVTGTDTGVGKTVFTALLLTYLRQQGVSALAMKPFCSGSRADARLFHDLQKGRCQIETINPFYNREPVAPLIAMRKRCQEITLQNVVDRIWHLRSICDVLLVEGCGGLLVPLGEGFLVDDVISALSCRVVVVAPNKLGALSQTLLTVRAIESRGCRSINIVLMGCKSKSLASRTNLAALRELVVPFDVHGIRYLGENLVSADSIERHLRNAKNTLAEVLGVDMLPKASVGCAVSRESS